MTLYLSRLCLNLRSNQVISELTYPYEMHRTLMRGFPEAANSAKTKARDEFGVLFRADVHDLQDIVKVYIQSRAQPDWSFLDGLKGYLCTNRGIPGYEQKEITQALGKIRDGQVYRFLLRANPTKRVGKRDDSMKGKRVELRHEEDQVAWLMRKGRERETGMSGGFEVLARKVRDDDGREILIPRVEIRHRRLRGAFSGPNGLNKELFQYFPHARGGEPVALMPRP